MSKLRIINTGSVINSGPPIVYINVAPPLMQHSLISTLALVVIAGEAYMLAGMRGVSCTQSASLLIDRTRCPTWATSNQTQITFLASIMTLRLGTIRSQLRRDITWIRKSTMYGVVLYSRTIKASTSVGQSLSGLYTYFVLTRVP